MGTPLTYSRLKDIIYRLILELKGEPYLSKVTLDTVFTHFINNDFSGAIDFDTLFDFLYLYYLPRIL